MLLPRVPMNTLPLATVGTVNFTALPPGRTSNLTPIVTYDFRHSDGRAERQRAPGVGDRNACGIRAEFGLWSEQKRGDRQVREI